MANKTNIEWTEFNWNPLSGCSRKSAGCERCYAETMTKRLAAMGQEKYRGLLNEQDRFNGVVKFSETDLLAPLKRRKPTAWFVNSMSDVFHSNVKDEWIDKMFAVMALTPQHTYQILTKRPERMADYLHEIYAGRMYQIAEQHGDTSNNIDGIMHAFAEEMPNVWLGVSVEDQKTADERIPLLLDTPAAIRWISAEPLLSDLHLLNYLDTDALCFCGDIACDHEALDWVVVGGESGPRARPCDIAWIRSIVEQCKSATVPVFVKQLGALPTEDESEWRNRNIARILSAVHHKKAPEGKVIWAVSDRKGGNPDEWPENLRVREYPEAEVV